MWLCHALLGMLRAMNSNDYQMIDTDEGLSALCRRLQDETWIAVDTEFMRESTYFPKLCLLQVATADISACIDILAIKELAPLTDLLYNEDILKVMHAARQDLEIFFHMRGTVPKPVFDTQLAAPLLGYPEQAGYAALVEAFLGVHLSKAHTRTDWSQRPLSAAQLQYAADDVRYLARLYPMLRDRLAQSNRLTWLTDDFAALTDASEYERPPDQAWLRVKGVQQVRGHRLATLQALAAWRELTARKADRPRNWLLRDEHILDLAKLQPADKTALSRIRGVNAQILHKYADELLDIIKTAKTQTPVTIPSERTTSRLDSGQEAIIDLLLTTIRVLAGRHDVNPAIITTRKELERLIQGDETVKVLQGWRRKLAGETLLAVLHGKFALQISADTVQLIEKA